MIGDVGGSEGCSEGCSGRLLNSAITSVGLLPMRALLVGLTAVGVAGDGGGGGGGAPKCATCVGDP